MQKNMQRARAAEATSNHKAAAPGAFRFPRMPWWAWLIVAAHLLYRIVKVSGFKGVYVKGWPGAYV